jgi:hypothetical protein
LAAAELVAGVAPGAAEYLLKRVDWMLQVGVLGGDNCGVCSLLAVIASLCALFSLMSLLLVFYCCTAMGCLAVWPHFSITQLRSSAAYFVILLLLLLLPLLL